VHRHAQVPREGVALGLAEQRGGVGLDRGAPDLPDALERLLEEVRLGDQLDRLLRLAPAERQRPGDLLGRALEPAPLGHDEAGEHRGAEAEEDVERRGSDLGVRLRLRLQRLRVGLRGIGERGEGLVDARVRLLLEPVALLRRQREPGERPRRRPPLARRHRRLGVAREHPHDRAVADLPVQALDRRGGQLRRGALARAGAAVASGAARLRW
jgi:hypothetical protein